MEDDDSQHDAKSLQGIPKQDELDRTRQYVESHRNVTFNSQNFRDNPVHSNTHLGDNTSAPFIPSTHQDQMPVSGPVETHDTNNPIGINPIMSKLPQSLQYKWRDKATNYKKSKNVPYPPFSFFVEFISDQASKYNDPGFKFESDQNNNSPQARDKESGRSSQRPRLSARNINVSKTEIATSTEGIKPIKLKCAIHKTNHSLNDCRSLLSKSIEDRRKIIKENGICFKCINSKDHLSRNCPENVQCKECDSSTHSSGMHIYGQQKMQPLEPNGGEQSEDADQATRSVSSEDIGSSCWLQGPTKFLSGELQASASTETLTTLVNPDLDKEVRPIVTVTKITIEDSHSIGSERFQNFSSWKSLVNGIAVLQRFIQSRFKKVTLQDIDVVKSLNESEIFIIKTIQSEVYSSEIDCIVNGQNLRKNSSIISVDPFLDKWRTRTGYSSLYAESGDEYNDSKNMTAIIYLIISSVLVMVCGCFCKYTYKEKARKAKPRPVEGMNGMQNTIHQRTEDQPTASESSDEDLGYSENMRGSIIDVRNVPEIGPMSVHGTTFAYDNSETINDEQLQDATQNYSHLHLHQLSSWSENIEYYDTDQPPSYEEVSRCDQPR
ncbi:unnamed protein product [Mytilus edulis]|uniref:Uncharacterized protein n=1 Tax=Mytilus edulis TaxID=6550 RepID=A0A8S3S545_MYTED|nr:unnamed protein product [Mytilus edulis]